MKINDIIEKKKGVEAHGNYQFFLDEQIDDEKKKG